VQQPQVGDPQGILEVEDGVEKHVAELDGGGGGAGVRDVTHGLDVLPGAGEVRHPHKVLPNRRASGVGHLHDGDVVVSGYQHSCIVGVEERGDVHPTVWAERGREGKSVKGGRLYELFIRVQCGRGTEKEKLGTSYIK